MLDVHDPEPVSVDAPPGARATGRETALHDLRNQLLLVQCAAEALAESIPANDERAPDVAALLDASQNALRLANEALGPPGHPTRGCGDVATLFTALEPRLRRLVGDRVTLRLAVEPGLPAVALEPRRIEDALLNLVLNARDAMPGGGGLMIDVRALTVRDRPDLAEGRYLAVAVADNGFGIDPHVLQRVFDPFFTTKLGGTGLGLPSVRRAVYRVGGAVDLESAPGEGTTVTLLIPAL